MKSTAAKFLNIFGLLMLSLALAATITPAQTRVRLRAQSSSTGQVSATTPQSYVFSGYAGQSVEIQVWNKDAAPSFSIKLTNNATGQVVKKVAGNPHAALADLMSSLPANGEYTFEIASSNSGATTYQLIVYLE